MDQSRFRIRRDLTPSEWRELHDNSRAAFMLRNEPGFSIPTYIDAPLIVIKPEERALRLIDDLPGAFVNYNEFAKDLTVPDPAAMQRLFDEHFVHPWRSPRHETVLSTAERHVTYTGQRGGRGRLFAWYSDRPSKLTAKMSFILKPDTTVQQPCTALASTARAISSRSITKHFGIVSWEEASS